MRKLVEKRDALLADMKSLIEKAKTEERTFSEEESSSYNKIIAEVEGLNNQIQAEVRAKELESSLAVVPFAEENREDNGVEEFRSILKMEKRDISYSENVFAPKGFVQELIKSLNEASFIRGLAKKLTLTKQEGITIPKRSVAGNKATWGNTITPDTDLAFGSVVLKPESLNKIVKLDKKVVKISALPIDTIVKDELVEAYANAMDEAYLIGDGVDNTPFGIFNTTAVPVGRDVTVGSGITAEAFISAKNKMVSGYNPVWVIHPDVLTAIESLKDGNGQYIFMNSFRAGEPDTILGIPVKRSDFAPSATSTGSYIACLADFGRGYAIADVEEMEMQVLTELYAGTNQVGYKGYFLTNGNVVDANAFVRVKVGA